MNLEEVMHHHMQNVYSELKHNPKAFNEASEVFARTKLIDLSNLNINAIEVYPAPLEQTIQCTVLSNGWSSTRISWDAINLPFTDCMVKFKYNNEIDTFLFIREYSPMIYTGTLIAKIVKVDNRYVHYTEPFGIRLGYNGSAEVQLDVKHLVGKHIVKDELDIVKNEREYAIKKMISGIINGINVINQLSPKTTDIYYVEPKGHEYIKRKGLPAIKIERPIYIYANKKTKATSFSEYSGRHIEHQISWSVRGHWRRLDSMQKIGKNAQGEYNVEGFTWVVPHISGNKNVEPSNRKYVAIGD